MALSLDDLRLVRGPAPPHTSRLVERVVSNVWWLRSASPLRRSTARSGVRAALGFVVSGITKDCSLRRWALAG